MSFKSVFVQMVYPQQIKCVVCGKDLFEENKYCICSGCSLKANVRFCQKCGRAIGETSDYCDDCKNHGRSFIMARAPFIFEGKAKLLVHRLKYGGAQYLCKTMAQYLADVYNKNQWEVDFITFVPMHIKREKSRGYNQAKLIASKLSEILNKPLVDTLERLKYSNSFAHMSRSQRIKEAEGSFKAKDKYKGKTILLIDDVFTTGSTTDVCSAELVKNGAEGVYVLTFCTAICKNELY